jgi:hypothetical protein
MTLSSILHAAKYAMPALASRPWLAGCRQIVPLEKSTMPKLIVGWNQKVATPNYGSRGASVTLELELDGPTAGSPERTRAQIAGLFRLARQAVTEELARASPIAADPGLPPLNNGHDSPRSSQSGPRLATANQIRAIRGLSARYRVDLPEMLRLRFGVGTAEELSLADASALIDELKARREAAAER